MRARAAKPLIGLRNSAGLGRRVGLLPALAVAAVLIALPVMPARAHHSMTVYELFATTMEGTVQEFRYVNPHVILVVRVREANGGTRVWRLEGDPPATFDRAGFHRDTFHAGDKLKLNVHRLKDGQAGGLWSLRTVVTLNGVAFSGYAAYECGAACN